MKILYRTSLDFLSGRVLRSVMIRIGFLVIVFHSFYRGAQRADRSVDQPIEWIDSIDSMIFGSLEKF